MGMEPIPAAIVFATNAEKKAKAYTDAAIAALPNGIVYRGAVDYYSSLPSSGQIVGDCYTVKYTGTSGDTPDGTEYVWGPYDGTNQWVSFSNANDGYTKAQADAKFAQKPESRSAGNIPVFDENGNLTDSDSKPSDYVKYVTLTISVEDENNVQATGITVTVEDPSTENPRPPITLEYNGQPVSLPLVPGDKYKVTVGSWSQHFPASPAYVSGNVQTDTLVSFVCNALSAPTSLAELAQVIQLGAAQQLTIGTTFNIPWTWNGTTYQVPVDIVDVRNVEDENGVSHEAVIIQWHYATPNDIQFDAPEQVEADEATAAADTYYYGFTSSGNVYTLLNLSTGDALPYGDYDKIFKNARRDTTCNMIRYGYNRYRDSAYRQWLNSIAGTGEWWSATHVGDSAPSQLNSVAGFMSGFTAEDRALMKKCKITCYTNSVTDGSVIDTMYDVWFLASGTEMYGSVNANEGTYFQYWKEATGWSSPNNGNNEGRIAYSLTNHSQACWHWLRSAYRSSSATVWFTNAYGNLGGSAAYSAGRALPACAIY